MLISVKEPAHSQIAANGTAYIILRLLKDGSITEASTLLGFAYDLIELTSGQGNIRPLRSSLRN